MVGATRPSARELRRAGSPASPHGTRSPNSTRLGINELAELAASVSLAGSHGARIRPPRREGRHLRGHQVAETEAAAEAATERMTVPVAVFVRVPRVHRLPGSRPDHLGQRTPAPERSQHKEATMPVPDPRILFAYCCARLGIDPHDERGMTTTEVAVITFLLVGAAIVVLGIITTPRRATPTTSRRPSSLAAEAMGHRVA